MNEVKLLVRGLYIKVTCYNTSLWRLLTVMRVDKSFTLYIHAIMIDLDMIRKTLMINR